MEPWTRRAFLQAGVSASAVGALNVFALCAQTPTPLPADLSVALVETTMRRYPEAASLGRWGYQQALFLYGGFLVYKRSSDPRYLAYIRSWADANVDKDGAINRQIDALDYMLPGRLMLQLFKQTGDQRYATAARTIRLRLDTYPRTEDGAFWHATTRQHQLWLDGTYMALPFLVEYGEAFHDRTYAYNEAAKQLLLYAHHLNDPRTGLLFHGYDESGTQPWADPATHRSGFFWARSIGWFGMALTDVLATMPADHPQRAALIALVRQLAQAYEKYQDQASGLWFNVVDRPQEPGNWLETSASSMYVYMLESGVQRGYLDAKYGSVACAGYRGVLSQLSVSGGDLHIASICDGTNVSDLAYYLARPRKTDDLHGLGAFLIMNELLRVSSCATRRPTVRKRRG
jgi:unsaturated rhamnogalacturonyl hydrolase